ncbi:putative mitochondrial precursor of N-acetylglutamate synthase [Triangularia setosa]|uniref:Amino-acid acetyltransferase, mitochondrial n=1 Tax=Triangularia setosa TaxID=2587417 RepID=A0AAN6W7W8_9PEZI|nr:putative mitochondrial precursor of N-acetylglutamate synthase [Podospora setosa]
MLTRSNGAWKKATSAAQASICRDQQWPNHTTKTPVTSVSQRRHFSSAENGTKASRNHPSSAEAKQKRESDREFLISVLESSATKRDAKAYLQTYGSSQAKASPKNSPAFTTVVSNKSIPGAKDAPLFVQGPVQVVSREADEVPRVAIVKLREPQTWDDNLLDGVAKTLARLRDLGLRSVIVLECDIEKSAVLDWKDVVSQQTDRLQKAIRKYGTPGAELVDGGIWKRSTTSQSASTVGRTNLSVGFGEAFTAPLRHGHILVVPSRAVVEETLEHTAADANDVIFALAKYFAGLQVSADQIQTRTAVVDRVIIIDPFGGIPASNSSNGARVFINLEEQFNNIKTALGATGQQEISSPIAGISGNPKASHVENLELVRNILAILPATASAVITSPVEAANLQANPAYQNTKDAEEPVAGEVKTRRWQNPIIHNLLTDRPIYSASLPIGRIKSTTNGTYQRSSRMPTTTLAKKGLPVTIFPDTRHNSWQPPKPGTPRLKLTDTCVDLPRLIHLINDSFGRELDAEHYLNRVRDSLAGIIIAGEYEGGAILTWERPFDLDEETAYNSGRLVPYLDKFAVLKKSQGAGGVADIVFNAMVRDCFPNGVCWRSRKDNPVNKWYFERSRGVRKLPGSNWAMFWTTPEAAVREGVMKDYEDVCRGVVPSWADSKAAD